MHIPDGFLTAPALAIGAGVAVAGLAVCARRVRAEQRERDLPVAGLLAAFFLVGDAPLFPVGLGTDGHLLGGMLAVCLLGPWLGATTITVVCAIQALALGDGGVSALGLNVVNLALIPAFVGYPLLLAARRLLPRTSTGLAAGCGVCAFACVVLAALLFVAEFAIGARASIDVTAIAGATLGTYVVIGAVEGVITTLIVRALCEVRPDLVRVAGPLRERALDARLRAAEPSERSA